MAPALRERLRLVTASKLSLASGVDGGPIVPVGSAARFEAGAPAHTAVAGWAAALDLLAAAGPEDVWRWVDRLAERLATGCAELGLTVVSPRTAGARSALVTVAVPGVAPEAVAAGLAAADVVASVRGAGVRLSPPAGTTTPTSTPRWPPSPRSRGTAGGGSRRRRRRGSRLRGGR